MQDIVTQRFIEVFEELQKAGKVSSQKEFADLLGFHEQYFGGYRSGARKVSNKVINKLCMMYDVSLTYMMSGKGDKFIRDEHKGGQYATAGRDIGNQVGGSFTQSGNSNCEKELAVALKEIEGLREQLAIYKDMIAMLKK